MNGEGFVLVGGKSSRMGRNKALLPWRGRTLLEHVVSAVTTATSHVSLVGDPAEYANFGYPVIPDLFPARGPLSGIHAALLVSRAEWNLVVACDMPEIDAEFLGLLMARAGESDADGVLPAGPSGRLEPLCAAYRRRAAASIQNALERDIRKVTAGLADLRIDVWRVPEGRYFHNLNTPEEWAVYANA